MKMTHDFLEGFSLKWPGKVQFSMSVIIIKKCEGQNFQIHDFKLSVSKRISGKSNDEMITKMKILVTN